MRLFRLSVLTLILCIIGSCHLPKADPLLGLSQDTVYPVRVATGSADSYECSGVQVYPNFVLTAAHCVADSMWVDNLKVSSTIVPNPKWDMALLHVPGIKGPEVKWADHRPKLGESAILIGWGCSTDHVSAKTQMGKVISVDDRDITYDVPVCFGDSGGPVYDQSERLIGIMVRKVQSNSHAVVQYLGENM